MSGPRAGRTADSWERDLARYAIGLASSLLLTAVPFALVAWKPLAPGWTFGAILCFGLAQLVVHLRCFLHISLSRSSRDDLNLLLFSGLIILLMAGGTLLIMFNLQQRMH